MRERMFATLGIWFALALAIDRILGSLSYYVSIPMEPIEGTTLDGGVQFFPNFRTETMFVPGEIQVAAFALMFLLVVVAFLSTAAIWRRAHVVEQERAAAREYEKSKRDREARIRRLLSTMDEDDLSALEDQHIGDDGERMSVSQLLGRKR